MQKHVKNYLDHFGYTTADIILCEVCGKQSTDIHHIKYRSEGGRDVVDNLVALCRLCHYEAHNHKKEQQKFLKELVKNRR